MIKQKRVTRFKAFFRWYDLWVGVFIDARHSALYICPIPMAGVKIWREDKASCHWCGSPAEKIAVDTGDGWALEWDCTDIHGDCVSYGEQIEPIEWPFGREMMSAQDLREHGYIIA